MFTFGSKKGFRRRESKATSAAARRPRLDRRNAVKNIDYEISSSSDESTNSGSLDFSPVGQSSFRIGGSIEGEVEHLYRSLGLSGPEDFAIPIAVWEASLKAGSSSDILFRSRLLEPPLVSRLPAEDRVLADGHEPVVRPPAAEAAVVLEEIRVGDNESEVDLCFASSASPISPTTSAIRKEFAGSSGRGDLGIKGTRPPVLTPPPLISALPSPPMRSVLPLPPSMTLPVHDKASSTWDIVRSFAPSDECLVGDMKRSLDLDELYDGGMAVSQGADEVLDMIVITGQTSDGSASFSTSIDDDSSSTTTEVLISPSGRFKKQIRSWMRGQLLGSGSFGTVYEGISDDGTFIAVKEVSLLDKGSNAQQCILQLEQEIALLSQFEHENIVQYYGTDKEESKLYIFLELVTQGSLASLYQKYHLRDTQVSAYTRQILHGLNYLHERDVVHRDIKCANILVHADGSIKLADFGLAKEMSKINDLKSCKGSVYWMAPEVVHPKKTYGRAADIWSLGCTVLEMLTRQIPYPNLEWQHAFYRIGRGDQPSIPSHLSMDAQDFIRKCVQVDPSARPIASQLLEHPFVSSSKRRPLHY